MSDVSFDILIKSVADSAALDRMRNNVRGMRTDLAGVNEMLAQNRGNFALSGWGDRLDVTKIRAAVDSTKGLASAGTGVDFGFKGAATSMLGFTSVAGAVTAVALGATAAVSGLGLRVTQLANELDQVTNRTGINGETYQAWKIVLTDAGQEANVLITSLDRLKQVIGDAGAGSEPAQQALAKVGLTFAAIKDLSIETQLELVARGLMSIENPAQRASAAQDLLARGFSQLSPLLTQIAEGTLPAVQEKLKETGQIMSNDMAKKFDEIGDKLEASARRADMAWAPFQLRWNNIKSSIGESLLSIQSLAGQRAEITATDWVTGVAWTKLTRRGMDRVSNTPNNWSGDTAFQNYLDRTAPSAEVKVDAATGAVKTQTGPNLAEIEAQAKAELAAKKAKEDAALQQELANRFVSGWLAVRNTFLDSWDAAAKKDIEQKKSLDQAEAERKLSTALNAQAERRADIEADWSRTSLEKRQELLESLREENRLISERIAALEKERSLADPIRRGQIDGEISGLSSRRGDINRQISSPNPNSYSDQFSASSTQLRDQVGTVPQQMAQAYGSSATSIRSSMRGAFLDIAKGNISLRDAVKGTPAMLGGAFLQAGTQMAADWAWKHVFMAGISKAWHATELALFGATTAKKVAGTGVVTAAHTAGEGTKTAATVAGETARLAATATSATVSTGIITTAAGAQATATGTAGVFRSIMELGPILGPTVMATSVAGMLALVYAITKNIGKHADGTIVRGPGTGTSDSILARLSTGEAVIPATRVAHYGEPFIRGLIDGRPLPTRTVAAPSGGSTQAAYSNAGPSNLNLAVVLDAYFATQLIGSKPGRKMVANVQSQGMREMGWES